MFAEAVKGFPPARDGVFGEFNTLVAIIRANCRAQGVPFGHEFEGNICKEHGSHTQFCVWVPLLRDVDLKDLANRESRYWQERRQQLKLFHCLKCSRTSGDLGQLKRKEMTIFDFSTIGSTLAYPQTYQSSGYDTDT